MKKTKFLLNAVRLFYIELSVAAFSGILSILYRRKRSLSDTVTVCLYRLFERLTEKADRYEIRFIMDCLEQ